MQCESDVHILWDASHIWGLMAWRALRALGVPTRLVKAKEIAEGALHGKPGREGGARLLLVPGGSAQRKAALLGRAGRAAVRDFVRRGGNYLGFCGGAGLALSHAREEQGLGLCPWTRAPYAQRFQHLISGHLLAAVSDAATRTGNAPPLPRATISLPVWWPGRFAPGPGAVSTLATSIAPDADLWLADLPLAGVAPHVLETWRVCYGVDLSPEVLAGQPLVICGSCGAGRYLLSYSHLETPESPAANAWLADILRGLGAVAPRAATVPAWHLGSTGGETPAPVPALVPASVKDARDAAATARRARAGIAALLDLGVEHHLFFRRTSWLWGWRAGLPGMACNNLLAAFAELEELARRADAAAAPHAALHRLWERVGPRFAELTRLFAEGAEGWLMASRLAATLAPSLPDAVDSRGLAHQRAALFGHPMRGGGLAEELLQLAEDCLYTAQDLADLPPRV